MNTQTRQFFCALTLANLFAVLLIAGIASNKKQSVVVNMPADAQPLSQLETDTKIIGPEKAVLWWTVYRATLDKGWSSDSSAHSADRAIETVYGK